MRIWRGSAKKLKAYKQEHYTTHCTTYSPCTYKNNRFQYSFLVKPPIHCVLLPVHQGGLFSTAFVLSVEHPPQCILFPSYLNTCTLPAALYVLQCSSFFKVVLRPSVCVWVHFWSVCTLHFLKMFFGKCKVSRVQCFLINCMPMFLSLNNTNILTCIYVVICACGSLPKRR